MFDFSECAIQGQKLKDEGKSIEDLLLFFRANGASITDSMKLLMRLENLSLSEAKRVVHFSNAWQDFRAASEELHESAEKAAREMEEETSN